MGHPPPCRLIHTSGPAELVCDFAPQQRCEGWRLSGPCFTAEACKAQGQEVTLISGPCLKRPGCDDLGIFGNLDHETHPLALSVVSICSWESSSISSQAPKNRRRNGVSVISNANSGLSGVSGMIQDLFDVSKDRIGFFSAVISCFNLEISF